MARKVDLTLGFLSYEGNLSNDPGDAIRVKKTSQATDVDEVFRYQIKVADAVSDQVVVLPDADSDMLLIYVDRTVSVKLNGIGTALTLKPSANGTKTPAFMMRGSITALTISNASGADANFDIIAVQL
jgi:hypothetical protein